MLLHHRSTRIQLGSKHVRSVFCSTMSSTAVVLVGSTDTSSSGRIWLEFSAVDDLDQFLEAANHMNDNATVRNLEE